MVTREQLERRGLRAYERGRLGAAARVAVLLVPVVLVCVFESNRRDACACLGALLVAIAVWLRWKRYQGMQNVSTGLIAGSVPLLTGLVIGRLAPDCASAGLLSACTAIWLAAGCGAGVWLGVRMARSRPGFAAWAATAGVAGLAASLGWVGLGSGALGTALGLLLGSATVALIARQRR